MKIKIKGIKPHEIYSGQKIIELLRDVGMEVEPEVQKYDWSKTLDDVLVSDSSTLYCAPVAVKKGELMPGVNWKIWIAAVWQPNIHGKCPVDPEASIVRILGGSEHGDLAGMMDWKSVKAWQFIRLAEGYEW